MTSPLSSKLEKLNQKRWHREFIEDSPASVCSLLEDADHLYGEDAKELMKEWLFPTFENGELTTTNGYRESFWCSEFDIISKAKTEFISKASTLQNGVVLWFGKDGPTYRVDHVRLLESMSSLFEYLEAKQSIICLVTNEDGSHGIGIDNYCGFIENSETPNPDETVYEVFGWKNI